MNAPSSKLSQKLKIIIHSAGMPFDGDTVKTKSLGGSESAAYYMARELAARGHEVICFTAHPGLGQGRKTDGVVYVGHGQPTEKAQLGEAFDHYATTVPHDLLIIQRAPFGYHKQFNAKVCMWQLHDLALYRTGGMILGGTWQIDYTTVVSEFHAEQVKKVWNINPEYLRVVPNGVDPSLYSSGTPALDFRLDADRSKHGRSAGDKSNRGLTRVVAPTGKFLLLYQSRPERGFENALCLMEKAEKLGLPIHLLACAYENTTEQMRAYYEALYERARACSNVTVLGALSKPELADLQMKCDLLLYPTKFEEVSCITAMEAMHAGLPMLTSECAALPETCKGSGTKLIPLKDGEVDLEAFEKQLVDWFGMALHGTSYPQELNDMRVQQKEAAGSRTWQVAADELELAYRDALHRKFNYAAAIRSAIEHSDIAFAKYLVSSAQKAPEWETCNHKRIVEGAVKELDRMYDFAEDPLRYAAHYAKHQGEYYDGPGANVVGEDVTQTTRFMGVRTQICDHITKTSAEHLRVLDYGCAHGHYTMPLSQMFNTCDFVGMDISNRAIEKANKWKEMLKSQNTEFHVGSQQDLDAEKLGQFDVIIAGEVLEHVWDYLELMEKLRKLLVPGGMVIFTTPLGRWEHIGTVAFRTGREHLHHFDREDIQEICEGHTLNMFHAPSGQDRSGFALGSWVWGVWPTEGKPFWGVDYNRKLLNYAPRQSVSACLIVKDGEKTLRRCVESFIDWVDEVIIAVDPKTTDRTSEVIKSLQIDFPNRPILQVEGKEALKDGFASARNESIKYACGQWILWVDADEELRNPQFIHKLARPSMHSGYGFAQVHYSVDPDKVLTTDFPCRMFRRSDKAKFHGYVHEHPEEEMGKAIPWSLVRPEMKFLHHGYYDEETRKGRFHRNLPLLMRDVKENTTRTLNKFLYLRDIAQGIQFESQMYGGFTPEHCDRALIGIKIMEEIIELPQVKMIADSMEYYSLCVAVTGKGFDANVSIQSRHPTAPDLAVNLNFQGRFHSRDFYRKLVDKVIQECTKVYEERYL